MNIVKRVASYNLVELVGIALGLIYTVVVARNFELVEIGKYALIISSLSIAGQLVSLGLPTWYLTRIKNHVKPIRLTSFYFKTCLASAFLFNLVGFILCYFVFKLDLTIVILVIVNIFFVNIRAYSRPFFLYDYNVKALSILALAPVLLQLLALVALVYLLQEFKSHVSLLVLFVFLTTCRALIGLFLLQKQIDFRTLFSHCRMPASSYLKIMFRSAIKINLNDLLTIYFTQLPYQIAGINKVSLRNVGVYSRVNQLGSLIVTATNSIFPLMTSYWLKNRSNSRLNGISLLFLLSLIITPFVFYIIDVFGASLIKFIYGQQYVNITFLKYSFFISLTFVLYKLLISYAVSSHKFNFSLITSALLVFVPFMTCFFASVSSLSVILKVISISNIAILILALLGFYHYAYTNVKN